MAKTKTIGGDNRQRRKSCAYCNAYFGWNALLTHIRRFGSDKIFCKSCGKKNFLYTTDNQLLRWSFLTGSFLIGFLIAVPGLLQVPLAFEEFKSTRQILRSASVLAVGAPLSGIVVGRYLVHVFDWVGAKAVKLKDQPSMKFIK